MTALQKIIHAQVTKGQISITEKTRGEKGAWHLRGGEQGKRLQPPEPKIKATKWPFRTAGPHRSSPRTHQPGVWGARGARGTPGGQVTGPGASACQGHRAGSVSRGMVATRTLERRNVLILSGHLVTQLLVSAPPALPPARQARRGTDRTSCPSCEHGSLTCHPRARKSIASPPESHLTFSACFPVPPGKMKAWNRMASWEGRGLRPPAHRHRALTEIESSWWGTVTRQHELKNG